jgi:hypothetical protein
MRAGGTSMKHALKAVLIAGALGVGALLSAPSASAHERGASVSVYVDLGDVSVAYRNGYYDHRRRWHSWRSRDEWRHFRRHHRSHYHDYDYREDRYDRDRRRDRGRHRGHRRHRDWRD